MSVAIDSPPYTPVESVTEFFHGVEVTDPYRWLEDQYSNRTRQWIQSQTLYARSYLDAIPGRDVIRRRVAEMLAVESCESPAKAANRYFYLTRKAEQSQPCICMREGTDGPERVLVDPTFLGQDDHTSVRIVSVSPNGKLLAYGVRQGGEDHQSVNILDVENVRTLIADGLPRGFLASFVFGADSLRYFYVHEESNAARPYYRAVYEHCVGSAQEDREIFFAGDSPSIRLGLRSSADGRYLAYFVVRSGTTLTIDLFLQDLTTDRPARLAATGMEEPFSAFFAEQRLIALTSWKAPNGRIVAIDPDAPDMTNWREIISESKLVIKDFVVKGPRVFVSYVENLSTRTDIFDTRGVRLGAIDFPTRGTARLLPNSPDPDELFFTFSSFLQPETIFTYNVTSGEQKVWSQKKVVFDATDVEVNEVRYLSKDKTSVPMLLMARKGVQAFGNVPMLLTAYGGFGKSMTPQFSAFATLLVEHGFVFAVANIRGGAELGRQWHLDGKRHNRQNAFDDFIAAAEWLIHAGYTSPQKLAVAGGSNGGLLVAAVLTQRPELFRAAISVGPMTDMLRYHRLDFSDSWISEFGSADDPQDFPHLFAYSPYQRIRSNVEYPAVLLVSGDADTRCNPMHARKFTARLQAATSSNRPILLGYSQSRGHMPTLPLYERISALTDRLAFVCDQLGMNL